MSVRKDYPIEDDLVTDDQGWRWKSLYFSRDYSCTLLESGSWLARCHPWPMRLGNNQIAVIGLTDTLEDCKALIRTYHELTKD
jgi:hypothetical protein